MADVVVGPKSLVFGCQRDRNLVQFERLLPVCSSRRLSRPQMSSGLVIAADECGNIFTLNADEESVLVMNSISHNKNGGASSWYQLVRVRKAVALAVGDISLWVVTSTGDLCFVRLRKSQPVRAATQRLIRAQSISDNVTEIVCVAVNETDHVFVGTKNGRTYASSGAYSTWHRLPDVDRRSSWISSIFCRNLDDGVIHCMAACVNVLYCCIGSNYDIWRYTFEDSIGNGNWQKLKLTSLQLCCISVSRDGFSMLLGIDTSGTLFVYHDVVSPNEDDWVEVSSENWLSVAIGQEGQLGVSLYDDDDDDDEQPARKKTALRSTSAESGGSSSSDEYVTAPDLRLSQRQCLWKTVSKRKSKHHVQHSAVVAAKQSTHSSTLVDDLPFEIKPHSLSLSCMAQLQVGETAVTIDDDVEQYSYDFKLEKDVMSAAVDGNGQEISSTTTASFCPDGLC